MKATAEISFSEAGAFLTAGFCATTGLLLAVAFIAPATRAQDDLADVDPTVAVARPAPPIDAKSETIPCRRYAAPLVRQTA